MTTSTETSAEQVTDTATSAPLSETAPVIETATAPPTVEEVIARLEAERALLHAPETCERLRREMHAIQTHDAALDARIHAVRICRSAVAAAEPRVTALTAWRDQLNAWRKTLIDELLTLPKRVYSDRDVGKQANLTLSIRCVDRSNLVQANGFELENLRLGDLMRASGYEEGPKHDNQVHGRLPWLGSLEEVEPQLRTLQQQLTDARSRLADVLREPADLAAEHAARAKTANAKGIRKTRGDGSTFLFFPDGHTEDLDEPLPPAVNASVPVTTERPGSSVQG